MNYVELILVANATILVVNTTVLIVAIYKIGKEVYRYAIHRH